MAPLSGTIERTWISWDTNWERIIPLDSPYKDRNIFLSNLMLNFGSKGLSLINNTSWSLQIKRIFNSSFLPKKLRFFFNSLKKSSNYSSILQVIFESSWSFQEVSSLQGISLGALQIFFALPKSLYLQD